MGGHSASISLQPGKSHIQIYLDLGFKNYTSQIVSEETTASEIIKNLKQKYLGGSVNTSNMNNSSQLNNSGMGQIIGNQSMKTSQFYQSNSSNSLPNMLNNSSIIDKQLSNQTSSNSLTSADFRKTTSLGVSQQNGFNTSLLASSSAPSGSKNQRMDSSKDDYGLFMINTRAQNPILFVRKLMPHDQVQRIYQKAVELFNKDGQDRFKIAFQRNGDIDQFIRSRGGGAQQFDEENHVVFQLGKSILNNKTYERKGKLQKKSLNSDKFKERQFLLDKDQLFYYKNEKQKDKNFNLIMLSNATICTVSAPKQKFCFEIETDNRKYILATKSQYDLDQWVYSIQGQIKLSRDNKNISDVNQTIFLKEKDIALFDMYMIKKIFKPKNVIFNPTQPILLDFINDPFINELLPNLTKYVTLVNDPNYQKHALDKAKDIMQQLRLLLKKLQKSIEPEKSSSNEEEKNESKYDQNQYYTLSNGKHQSFKTNQDQNNQKNEDFKRYKELKPAQKIQQIFSKEDFDQMEKEYDKIISDSLDATKQLVMNPNLFTNILLKINRIIKYNYLEDFFKERKIELLSIPNMNFKQNMPRMEFNTIGQSLNTNALKRAIGFEGISSASKNENINIFEHILIKKAYNVQQQSRNQQNQIDSTFQSQLRTFLGNISQEQRNNQSMKQNGGSNNFNEDRNGGAQQNLNNISGISKVSGIAYR